jgi:hypothetical protein
MRLHKHSLAAYGRVVWMHAQRMDCSLLHFAALECSSSVLGKRVLNVVKRGED